MSEIKLGEKKEEKIDELFTKLLESGASIYEVDFWRQFYPSLGSAEKEELIQNIESQIALFSSHEQSSK